MKKTTPKPTSQDPQRAPTTKPLTKRENAFCFAWVKLRAEGKENRAEAARMAGYKGRVDTLSKEAARVLAKPQSQKLISELTQEALAVPTPKALTPAPRFRYIMGIHEILSITTFLARATFDDVLDENGRFDIRKARETKGIHAIQSIQFHEDGSVKSVRLRDKNASVELMGRHFQLWEEIGDPDAEIRRLLEMEAEERLQLAIGTNEPKAANG